SKFVPSGSKRIESTYHDTLPNVAFLTPEGSLVMVVLNNKANKQQFIMQLGDERKTVMISARSVATFVWYKKCKMICKSHYSLRYIFEGFAIFLGSLSCSSEEPQTYEPPKKQEELGKARVFLTTGDQGKLLSEETALTITTLDNGALSTIQLFPEEKLQQIEGFGAALTGSSAFLIHQKLNHSQRGSLLKELFSKEDGIGLFYLRLTMGASDFSLSNYTYNDLPQGETDY